MPEIAEKICVSGARNLSQEDTKIRHQPIN